MGETAEIREASLTEIAVVFLKLGTIAFGGPAAHLAMMEEEFVRRRQWMTRAEFLDRLATANLIPGPSSTEVAIFVGQLKGGWRGLVVAGCCFIIPAAVIVSLIAWTYVRFGSLPKVEGMLAAIKPAVVAIVIQALGKLGRTALPTALLAVVAVLAAALSFVGVSPVLVLVFAGVLSAASSVMKNRLLGTSIGLPGFFGLPKIVAAVMGVAATGAAFPVGLMRLFLSFLKIGSVVFGSGYVLLAFLQAEFVERLHWLTDKQLIDAIAVGQFTPGPVFTTATFIGYIVAGWAGAVVATVGIFLPGFVLVAVSGPLIPRLRRSAVAAAALDGVVAGSLALIAVVAWQLGRASIIDRATLIIFVASLIALLRFRINSAWLVAAAAVVGWFMR
ncbi:MAG TPA: chromate efflux transporter [Terriglobales bacterium]|jgi:chromate transporter|nr:chromate efflux transporter [Terriglobales bacterium]